MLGRIFTFVTVLMLIANKGALFACQNAIDGPQWTRELKLESNIFAGLFREKDGSPSTAEAFKKIDDTLRFEVHSTVLDPTLPGDAFKQIKMQHWQALGFKKKDAKKVAVTRYEPDHLQPVIQKVFDPILRTHADDIELQTKLRNLNSGLRGLIEFIHEEKKGNLFMNADAESGPYLVMFVNAQDLVDDTNVVPGTVIAVVIARQRP